MKSIATILKETERGAELSSAQALALLTADAGIEALCATARRLNELVNGDVVTFVHNRNVNYTNICVNRCRFCAFRRKVGDEDAFFLPVQEVIRRISLSPGISEVCIQGGLHPGLDMAYILDLLRSIRSEFPDLHIHAFSPMEIHYFAQQSAESVEAVLVRLKEAGLDSLPGTAAEILDDEIRALICPRKLTTDQWVRVITAAHRLGLPTTATILVGHVEQARHIVRHMEIIRSIQKQTGGFTEFIPLFFMPHATELGRRYRIREVMPFEQACKLLALARVYYHGRIRNIQASWPKLGLDRAVETLSCGVNDLGGTLYEENITSSAGGRHGQGVSIHGLAQRVQAVGKRPFLRDTAYRRFQEIGFQEGGLRPACPSLQSENPQPVQPGAGFSENSLPIWRCP
jgi:FO synthase subunit 2